ncbi:MAG: TlpA family protein disulfide reductase [Chloroflexi bacterium]|nr:TlpA family protein disulfide reductase [Chloroflexota bacterium]
MALVGAVAAVGFAIAATGQTGQSVDMAGGKVVGKPAPEFALTTFDGGEVKLSHFRGQVVMLNFWASWCPPCRAEAADLESVWQAYKDRGVVFLGVDIQDTEPEARAFLEQFNITYPNGPDTKGRIMVDYGITNIPTSVFVSKEGLTARRWVGAIDRAKLTQYLDELLAQ